MVTTEFKKVSGIYKITSTFDERCYIGSAISLYDRLIAHRGRLRKGLHRNGRLQNYFNKYGDGFLIYEIIELCSKDKLIEREQYYIDTINPFFNIARIAQSALGIKRSEETKKRIGLASRNRVHPKGIRPSAETRMKQSIAKKGIKFTLAQKEKATAWRTGRPSGMLGKTHSDETRKKMSDSKKGVPKPQSYKDKLSGRMKGNKLWEKRWIKV